METQATLDATRQALAEGLGNGNAMVDLTAKINGIFRDPYRSFRIAQTEAARALMGGQVMEAQESGVVETKRWVCDPEACDFCKTLDGMEVGLNELFAVVPGNGPYSNIPHPPAHPFCFCVTEFGL